MDGRLECRAIRRSALDRGQALPENLQLADQLLAVFVHGPGLAQALEFAGQLLAIRRGFAQQRDGATVVLAPVGQDVVMTRMARSRL